MSRLTRALALAALTAAPVLAQTNLVPNPSFDNYTTCPFTDNQLNFCTSWYKPTPASSDYMNACHTSVVVGVPNNVFGVQNARTGTGYIHLICGAPGTEEWREYAQCQLSSPMSAGQIYDVSFYISRSDCDLAVGQIGAYFSTSAISQTTSDAFNLTPHVETSSVITDTTNWVLVSGTYTASGGEQYLTLGNFRNAANTTTVMAGFGHRWGSYYFEDVSVTARPQQGGCDSELIGWADMPLPATTGFLDVQDFENNCRAARTICQTQTPVRASVPYGGGTAYNQAYRTVWVSDGSILAEYYTANGRLCRPRCPAQRALLASRTARVSGLAFSDRRQLLYQLATSPGYYEITMYDASGRCLGAARQCRGTLPTGALAAGLAYDELNDLLFVSIDIPQTGGGYQHLVYVMDAARPCGGICKSELRSCTRQLTTGLAYDSCNGTLYATDGQVTQSYSVDDARRCRFTPKTCCKKQHQPTWRGLAILPCLEKASAGKSCTTRPCPDCPNMVASCSGDPALGRNFPITLTNAPASSTAFLYVKLGGCGTGIDLPGPFFCGRFYPIPVMTTLGPISVSPSTLRCGGRATALLPILPDTRLCGQKLCAQWVLFCSASSGFGFGLSNAIEFTVVGS